MVSFYDYAFLEVKPSPIILVLLLTFGCHNNAHLRTQKILEKKESVISISGVLPIGGIDDSYSIDDENGILGMRGELSYIKGFGNYELGPYAGFGFSDLDDPGFILGFDYKNYLNISSNRPIKFGAQFELNSSEYGQVFHIKPSLITVTNQKKAGYFGIHGLLYNGSLKLWNPSPYNYSSLGFGFTIGTEYISSKLSIQAQTDLSVVNNAFRIKGDSNFLYYDDYNYDPGDDYYLLVGLSAGVNFFNAPEGRNKFFEPMPIPNYKKVKTKDIHYDPNTGEVISSGTTKFDPNTGELLSSQTEIFNPNTGEKIIKHHAERSYKEEDKFTERQLIDLAKKNAQEKHIGALWSLFGLTGVPSSAFGSIFGLLILGEVGDGTLAFPGFILGGMFGATLPSALAKGSSKLTKVAYPPEIETTEQEMKYKKTYKSEIGVLRQKSTAIGTVGGVVAFAAFIMLVVVGN